MVVAYGAMVLAGLVLVVWGLPAAHRLKSPWDSVASLAVLAGVISALVGALLICVPNFFKG
ncbi:hypothetical protein GMLC_10410 [Geomonas limicola]|uniref:Uncharacterized protein n=1 Tax=Geomonas limicola TaxID=2740186 RepID=A0A6V8N4H5_9BACT|nr:hypothetical protein [Geomonas limicola]GFO67462.1 hypothetical protein GMLC_10410 [Geomonas limicola]